MVGCVNIPILTNALRLSLEIACNAAQYELVRWPGRLLARETVARARIEKRRTGALQGWLTVGAAAEKDGDYASVFDILASSLAIALAKSSLKRE